MRRLQSVSLAVALVLVVSGLVIAPAIAATEVVDTTLVSVANDGTQADNYSWNPAISADGSTIAYQSFASNLVTGDTNGKLDVFVYDVATATTTRVSVASDGTQTNNDSEYPTISADGSTIAYHSWAANLVTGDTNGNVDVFVYDVATATTTRVSVASDGTQANHQSFDPAISADGSTIAYQSFATNLVTGDTNGRLDVFVYDVATATTTRVSVASDGTQTNGDSRYPVISADGSTIAYRSEATNLVTGDTNGRLDVFGYDMATATTTRVSVASDGTQTNHDSYDPAISADGSTIAYHWYATNLVTGDTNNRSDVFVYDMATATTTRVSVASDGTQANNPSYYPAISADGSTIVYHSYATNLATGDSGGSSDVFVYDVATATTTQVSVASDGTPTNGDSNDSATSADGFTIAYRSFASNLATGDSDGSSDVFVTRINRSPDVTDPFDDDDGSIFEDDIEWLAAQGITKGCNPPANDKFCPTSYVTRGEMAASLVRALGYTDNGGGDLYVDDDSSIFEAEIDRLGTAGVTLGCNPPANDKFCPTGYLTRGQMAAFLVRALGYTDDGGGDLYVDDDGSIFEAEIDRLGTAGVTLGCNPPANDKFCPTSYVTRQQMAAALHRALE